MTGGDIPIGDFSYQVNTDLSANQFYAVYLLNTGMLAVCPTGNYAMLGILQDNPNGSATGVNKTTIGTVRELGHSKCWVDTSAIVAGSPLKIGATAGMLSLGAVGTDVIVAIACEANSSTSCIIEVALTARTAQGTSARAGQLTFSIPMADLGVASGAVNPVAAAPLGFTGNIVDMYAVVMKAASTSGATSLALEVTSTPVTGLACPVTAAHAGSVGYVNTSTGKGSIAATGVFGPTDTLTVISTSTVTFSGDAGILEVHVIYN